MVTLTDVKVELLPRGQIRLGPEGRPELEDSEMASVAQKLPPRRGLPLVWIANDLIALRDEDGYLRWLERRWGNVANRRRARRWVRAGLPRRLFDAAAAARSTSRLPYSELSGLLDHVVYLDSAIDVPDFPTLAAWALARSVEEGVQIIECEECRSPWLTVSAEPPRYCYRPAPGKLMTCAQLHAHERFAKQQADWNKEYRRIYARKQRGTVSAEDFAEWYAAARAFRKIAPGTVYTFDGWKMLKNLHPIEARRLLVEEYGEEQTDKLIESAARNSTLLAALRAL
jgi:hypothetical protein